MVSTLVRLKSQSLSALFLKSERVNRLHLHRSFHALAVAEEVTWWTPAGLQPHLFSTQQTLRFLSQKAAEKW